MKTVVAYHLCPRCFRAVAEIAEEIYCPNDGEKLLVACPRCEAPIALPDSRFCVKCGFDFAPRASVIGSWRGA
jgi:predicted amidophosphoribosyltransferase